MTMKKRGRPKATTGTRPLNLSVRVDEATHAALSKAAQKELRTMSSLAAIYIQEKLKENGWLK